MFAKIIPCGKDAKKENITKELFIPHYVAWEYGILVIAFCLFLCALSWDIALQDVYKLEHTQTFLFFLYYLDKNRFGEDLFRLFVVVAEWIIYIRLYSRAKKSEKHWGSVLYFTIVMTLHIIICLHATFNQEPDYNVLTYIRRDYCFFANVTVSPSVVYCVVYIWHIGKLKVEKNGTGDGSLSWPETLTFTMRIGAEMPQFVKAILFSPPTREHTEPSPVLHVLHIDEW